jgi:hypothetical protein
MSTTHNASFIQVYPFLEEQYLTINASLTNAKMANVTQILAFCLVKATELDAKMLSPFTYVTSNYHHTMFHSNQKLNCHRLLAKCYDLALNNPAVSEY